MGRVMPLGVVTLLVGINLSMGAETALAQAVCSGQAARKLTAQEHIAQRDIQEAIDQEIEEFAAKDLVALSRRMPPEFTIRLQDGTTLNREQAVEGIRRDLESVLSIDLDRTYTRIECLTLKGKEAIVYTSQQYVRTFRTGRTAVPTR